MKKDKRAWLCTVEDLPVFYFPDTGRYHPATKEVVKSFLDDARFFEMWHPHVETMTESKMNSVKVIATRDKTEFQMLKSELWRVHVVPLIADREKLTDEWHDVGEMFVLQ